MTTKKEWRQTEGGTFPGCVGSVPKKCNLCDVDFEDVPFAIDGRTVHGTWAWMCPDCHFDMGVGLGMGRGQRYVLVEKEPVTTDNIVWEVKLPK